MGKASRKPNRALIYDFDAGTASIDGVVYDCKGLPDAQRDLCMLRGMATVLMTSEDAGKAYARLVAGERLPIRQTKSRADERLKNSWREAASIVYTKALMAEQGVTPRSGQPLHETTEFVSTLRRARQIALRWTLAQLSTAKRDPGVLAEYRRLEGLEASPAAGLASLFPPAASAKKNALRKPAAKRRSEPEPTPP